jgi:hypothetical protein
MVASLSPSARLRALSATLAARIAARELDCCIGGRALQGYVVLLRMLLDTGRIGAGRVLALAVLVEDVRVPPIGEDQ